MLRTRSILRQFYYIFFCFEFLLGITVFPGEIKDNGYAIFFSGLGGGGGALRFVQKWGILFIIVRFS